MDVDNALIEARIYLLCGQGTKELANEYCFRELVSLRVKPMMPDWSEGFAHGLRTMSLNAMGSTFAEALEGAEKEVMKALRPLAIEIHRRKERLSFSEWKP